MVTLAGGVRRRAEPSRGMVERLLVTCWCESKTAEISTEDVRALRTWSCGHPFCLPLKGYETARRAA